MTKQRAVILDVLRSDKLHHTAEEIFELAKDRLPSISRATVYNNLHALENEKIIRKIGGEGSSARYDNTYVPHGHLFCPVCRGVYDIESEQVEIRLSELLGEQVTDYELKVRARCRACRQN